VSHVSSFVRSSSSFVIDPADELAYDEARTEAAAHTRSELLDAQQRLVRPILTRAPLRDEWCAPFFRASVRLIFDLAALARGTSLGFS
jgi:hypothetical protein